MSVHRFPRDAERCKQWLRVIKHPKFGEGTAGEDLMGKRVCSLHFNKEDFELNVLGMKRTALKDTAIPSVFTFPEEGDEQPGPSNPKRTRLPPEVRLAVSAPL